jgi:hypothetical protein
LRVVGAAAFDDYSIGFANMMAFSGDISGVFTGLQKNAHHEHLS